MGIMLDKLREYLQSATQEQLDAKFEELSEFLTTEPLVGEYLETLPQREYQNHEYQPIEYPEFTLDISFI
jgi:hypothetical protein